MASAIKIQSYNLPLIAKMTNTVTEDWTDLFGRYVILGDSGDVAPWYVLSDTMFHQYYRFVFEEHLHHFVEIRKWIPRPGL